MKKLVQILFFAITSIAFVACGSDEKKNDAKKECCDVKDKKECTPADSAKYNAGENKEVGEKCCAKKGHEDTTDSTNATTEEESNSNNPEEDTHSHEGHNH